MTAKATKTRIPHPRPATQSEAEFRRWTPEQVVEQQLLPYSSVRTLKERCYRREIWHHNDNRRITFTAEDLRRNAEMGACAPLSA
ncbi:hypothetical protein [Streptomyces massasporeus]|uniref:hypothetical protein n=1 Tax=Streptomyces massasporeus TaxID=67324 RepID=UPI00382E7659